MSKDKSYIYLVQQGFECGYDTFDAFVVIADSEEQARNIHPKGIDATWDDHSWCPKHLVDSKVHVRLIGITHKQDVEIICKSFNAG